jgi:methylated-DNA-[protein]-cysteine S-methyltransferase
MTAYTTIPSPIGELLLAGDEKGLSELHLPGFRTPSELRRDDALLAEPRRQLEAYFAGELQAFDVPLSPRGTEFQRSVWDALLEIPYGETASYGEIAARIGSDNPRAVGSANGRNPIAIVIPCHRVIGADGSLVGYGGGLDRKRWLLDHEASLVRPSLL